MPIATLRMEILEAAVRHNDKDFVMIMTNQNVTCHMTCAYVTPVTAMFMHSMMIIIDIIIMIDSLHSLES